MIRLIFLSTLLLARAAHLAAAPAPASADKPNIIFILADDLGYGDVGCFGATKVKTPHIDRLAREGMRFTNAHSPASVCTPSRYNLLTGRYCWRTYAGHGTVWANDPLLIEEGRMTVASLLRDEGYFTGCVGKWHLGFGRPGTPGWDDMLGPDFNRELRPGPLEVGFEYFYGMPAVGQHPNIFIEGRSVVGLNPADPLRFINDPRPEFRVPYDARPRTSPTNLQLASGASAEYKFEDGALRLAEKAVQFIEEHKAAPFFLYYAPRNIHSPIRPNPRFKGTSEIGVYGDFIHELDWSVGEVLGALDRNGLTNRTLVIFSSDNGGVTARRPDGLAEVNGHRVNGPLRGMKTDVYEGGQRVAMLARWPGRVPAGTRTGALVANTDLLATLAELFGRALPANAGEDSFSYLGTLLGKRGPCTRRSLVTDSMMGLYAITEGSWKLIAGQGGGGHDPKADREGRPTPTPEPGPPGQLYNLDEDLGERHNLYSERPDLVRRLTAQLEEIKKSGRSRPKE